MLTLLHKMVYYTFYNIVSEIFSDTINFPKGENLWKNYSIIHPW